VKKGVVSAGWDDMIGGEVVNFLDVGWLNRDREVC